MNNDINIERNPKLFCPEFNVKSENTSRTFLDLLNKNTGKSLIIHMGMHKTGSTSIQNTMSKNHWEGSYEYLNLISANHSAFIVSLFSQNPSQYIHNQGLTEEQVKEKNHNNLILLQRRLTESKENVIISGEDIGSALSIVDLEKMKSFFCQYFKAIYIIGYVRPPMSFVQSAFCHHVTHKKKGTLSINPPQYRGRFNKFDSVFGKQNVLLIKFDKKQLYDSDVVKDFGWRLGIQIPSDAIVRSNESLPLEALSVLYTYNKYVRDNDSHPQIPINGKLIQKLSDIGHSKLLFNKSLLNTLLSNQKDDIEWMENRLSKPLLDSFSEENCTIKKEEDLLNIAVNQYDHLLGLLKKSFPKIEKSPEGIAKIMELLVRHEADINTHVQLSHLHVQKNELSKAIEEISIAIDLQNDNSNFHNHLGNLFMRIGDPDSAEKAYKKAIELDFEMAGPHAQLSHLYTKKNELSKAIEEVSIAIDLQNDNSNFHNHLGNLFMRIGDPDSAEKAYKKAIELDFEMAGPHAQLSHLYTKKNELSKAIEEISIAIDLQNDNSNFHNHLGNLFMRIGDPDSAEKAYKKAIELDFEMASPHAQLSHLYTKKNELSKAIEEISIAIDLQNDNSNFHNHLGNLFMRIGDPDSAEKTYQKANERKETDKSTSADME